ncbi:MAG: sodium:alanine symporter family protein, partial [Candidatus Hydrogenedentota bacterium]
MQEILKQANEILGGPLLIVLLVGTGLFLTIRLRFVQFRYLLYAARIAIGRADREEDPHDYGEEFFSKEKKDAPEKEGDISYWQALTVALSATIGTGNIVGVAAAILTGGPGALFWMWVTALVGMATKYSEALLAVKYREKTELGYAGGPMYYIEKGLKKPWLGKIFAFLTLVAALGIGNMFQINAAAGALSTHSIGISPFATSLGVALIAGLVILGGIQRIGKAASFLVPFMAGFYFFGACYILIRNIKIIPLVFAEIFHYAFEPLPAISGTIAGLLLTTIRSGVSRGLFSNEAGLGSAPIAAAAAKTDYPVKQGLVSMLGPFIDTLIICTLTGLTILTGLYASGDEVIRILGSTAKLGHLSGSMITAASSKVHGVSGGEFWNAFFTHFGKDAIQLQNGLTAAVFQHNMGIWGHRLVSLGLFFFAVSTIIGWYYYSDRALVYLGFKKWIPSYQLVYVLMIILGGMANIQLIWDFSAVANVLMAFPNLIALLWLSRRIRVETKSFFHKHPHRYDN